MGEHNLVTTYTFHGQEYLFKMNVLHNNLEILVTDKNSGEEWQCSYDATYVENLTQKTGNFKQFDIFVAMIKSGLLRTSESVTLDLLTFEDLELLRSRKITKSVGPTNNNKRYLIITYVVEFDKIRYPLPLEYCGPPDPVILQATIRRLEVELAKTKEELALKGNSNESRRIYFLQKRVDELTEENAQLQEENLQLKKYPERKPKSQVVSLQKAVSNLEKSVARERNSHHELVEKLRQDKEELVKKLEKVKCSERCLQLKLNKVLSQSSRIGTGDHSKKVPSKRISTQSVKTMFNRSRSPNYREPLEGRVGNSSEDLPKSKPKGLYWDRPRNTKSNTNIRSRSTSSSSARKYLDPENHFIIENCRLDSPASTLRKSRTRNLLTSQCSSGHSSRASSRASSRRSRGRKKIDYKKLEEKIEDLQKMLKTNLMYDK